MKIFSFLISLNIRWDILITLLLSIFLEIILIIKRNKKNKNLNKIYKKDIFQWEDFAFSITTSATFYGGISAIFFALTGKLLFEMNMIISEEYIILFAGLVLIAFAFSTYKNALKKIKNKK